MFTPYQPIGIVTRPGARGSALCATLADVGIAALHQPMVEIVGSEDAVGFSAAVSTLSRAIVIVTSVNAVRQLSAADWAIVSRAQLSGRVVRILSIGSATQAALAAHDIDSVSPERHHSEGMIDFIHQQGLDFTEVLLIKGHGGRALLRAHYLATGKVVREVCVYRREPIATFSAETIAALSTGNLRWVVCTSVEMLQQWAGHCQSLTLSSPAVVVCSERMQTAAAELGLTVIARSEACDNANLVHTLQKCG